MPFPHVFSMLNAILSHLYDQNHYLVCSPSLNKDSNYWNIAKSLSICNCIGISKFLNKVINPADRMKMENPNQFIKEHNEWQRRLDFIAQENALLKYRLSEMVDVREENSFLQLAESFQNELLLIDENLQKLNKELKSFESIFREINGLNKKQELIKQHNDLRKSISQFAEEFLHFTNQFNKKMLLGTKI